MSDRILKKSKDRMIAGVCAGIAEFLGGQPKQVRLIFIVFILFGGAGLLAYIILWAAMPPSDTIPPGKFNIEDFREQQSEQKCLMFERSKK